MNLVFDIAKTAFFVDFDDTLIEPQPNPTRFDLPGDLRALVERIAGNPRLHFTVVTGRSVAQIDSFFAPTRLSVIGCHGCEMRVDPDGVVNALHQEIQPAFRKEILGLVSRYENVLVEDKGYAIAMHIDDLTLAPFVEALRAAIAAQAPLYRLASYGSCLEIRPVPVTKGLALKKALDQNERYAGRMPIYIGDDTGLDDSLMFLRTHGGALLRVGASGTTDDFCFSGPSEVRTFLNKLASSR